MRLLVVEDEPDLRNVVATALREEGYAVDTADDGREGLYKATTWDYDAVLLDVMLPIQDGWQVLQSLRKVKTTPVLMLTARDTVQDRVRGLDTGADDYLVKPFQLAELMARVRALIRRSAGQPDPEITVGPLKINTAAQSVINNGETVPLTAMEYSLLEFLVRHRGKLVTRTMIYEHLFDESDDSLSNLVEVHVSNIRKKIGTDLIKTRRGQGYMIDD